MKLHVGLVGPLPPPNGGMAMQTRQLAELLRAQKIEVSQLATNRPYRPGFIGRVRGVRALFRLLPYLVGAWRLAGRVDVIHLMANSGWSWQLFSAPVIWVGTLRKTPVIVNYRGGEALSYFQRSFSRVKLSLNLACSVIVPSGYLETVFQQFNVKTSIVPNIIDLNRFSPKPMEKTGGGFTLIVTRNLEAIYGIDMAINAVSLLQGKIDGLELKIAGSGPQLDELTALVHKLKLQGTVTFSGRIDREDICSFYQSADVMLNPTTVDNMPNSILEALASGVAVVSTDVGGVAYVVEDEATALLVKSGDETQMADAILRLYQDRGLRNRLVENGILAVSQYAWPRVKDLWIGHYRAAIQGTSV